MSELRNISEEDLVKEMYKREHNCFLELQARYDDVDDLPQLARVLDRWNKFRSWLHARKEVELLSKDDGALTRCVSIDTAVVIPSKKRNKSS